MFIFRNPSAFSHVQGDGGFSWVEPTIPGMTYLDTYYAAAKAAAAAYSTGSGYKGFNDTLAAWSANRVSSQECGQTWLNSIAEAGKFYSTSNQMLGIQMVTWNDYEEGTELETGIDNCVTVSASASGSVVSWKITGQVNTLDHFNVFVSQDGENLMQVGQAPPTATSLDLTQFGLDAGTYTVYVEAVGKPMLTNKMSAPVQITLSGTPAPTTGGLSVSTPSGSTATVKAGQTASYKLQLAATGTSLNVSITCSGTPPGSACHPPAGSLTVDPKSPSQLNLSVHTTAKAAGVLPGNFTAPPAALLLVVLFVAPVGLVAQKFLIGRRGRRFPLKPAFVVPLVVLATMALATGCGKSSAAPNAGNSPASTSATPTGTYIVVVTATSGTLATSTELTLNVQ
jgi:hypothetical protein